MFVNSSKKYVKFFSSLFYINGEDKTKCILFGSKQKLKNAGKLNIMYNVIEIKQYFKVTYLALKTIKK